MNIDTGEIILEDELQSLPEEQQARFIPITEEQKEVLEVKTPKKRIEWYHNELRHQKKEIMKRRQHTKRSAQARHSKKK